jgi:uncharacterized protein YoxC
MSFTREEFLDLVRLLEQQPEWRAELRRLLLTEDVLELPGTVQRLGEGMRALTEAQHHTTEQITALVQQMQALTQRVDSLTQRVDALAQQMQALTQRVDALAEQVQAFTQRVDALAEQVQAFTQRVDDLAQQIQTLTLRVDSLTQDIQLLTRRVDSLDLNVSSLKGWELESRYREKAPAYFQRLVRRIHVLFGNELSRLLDKISQPEGRLTVPEVEQIAQADVIARGRRREDDVEVYLVVEVSWGVGPHDVERAARRAKLLASAVGIPTMPVVAGQTILPEAADLAKRLKVWQVLDGSVTAPTETTPE